jgi:OmcA/MtrC family decaheme c-type cytochrome
VFPGDLAACQTCHLENTYTLPLSSGIHPTTITQKDKVVASILPDQAICTTCHDDPDTAGHVALNTTANGVETCLVCHGPNREFDVAKVHK